MAKSKELTPYTGPAELMPGLNLRALRRSVLMEGGLLNPRMKYESKEERKAAAKARGKARRESRKAFLEQRGLAPAPREKLSKAQKRARSKEFRAIRNAYLRTHPEEAKRLGVSIGRLRV